MSIKLGFKLLLLGSKASVESEMTHGTERFEVAAILIARLLIEMGDG